MNTTISLALSAALLLPAGQAAAATVDWNAGANVVRIEPYEEALVLDIHSTDTFYAPATRQGSAEASSEQIPSQDSCDVYEGSCAAGIPESQNAYARMSYDLQTGVFRGFMSTASTGNNYVSAAGVFMNVFERVTVTSGGVIFLNMSVFGDHRNRNSVSHYVNFAVELLNVSAYQRDPLSDYFMRDEYDAAVAPRDIVQHEDGHLISWLPVDPGDVVEVTMTMALDTATQRGTSTYDFEHTAYAGLTGQGGAAWVAEDPEFLSAQVLGSVPLPGAAVLLGAGLAGLGLVRRKG